MDKTLSIDEVNEELNDNKCERCCYECNVKFFQRNFENWTSGNSNIDKLIQDTQLLAHKDSEIPSALEWISYDRLDDIKYIEKFGIYRANRIDGRIQYWDKYIKDWKRCDHNMIVKLKILNNLNNITFEFINEIKKDHEFYGITQDPETNNYMIVFNDICKKCNKICNAICFQHHFIDWTSGNKDIDKLIQDTQLLAHKDSEISSALEWIPNGRLNNIKYIEENKFGKVYRANWIYGSIYKWSKYRSKYKQNWKRYNKNMIVKLNSLDNLKNVTFEFINEIKKDHKLYGITQDPETNNYIIVFNDICKKCNKICNAICFQQKFIDWTSSNDDIDKLIQDTQLLSHSDVKKALEWIPYDRLDDIKYVEETKFVKVYRANWIDGYIYELSKYEQDWIKKNHEFYGITQDPETNDYMIVFNDICKKCNKICNAICFQQKFIDWTSGNDDIDKLIQNTQLLSHNDAKEALEWIPYDRLDDIKYIEENKFGKVYRANWIDGYICELSKYKQDWIKKDHKLYGITQDPETNNYTIVFNDICKKCNKICNAIFFQQKFIDWTSSNDDIDKLIQDTQLSSHEDVRKALEWIPYDRLDDIKYIKENKFGKVYRANWIGGYILSKYKQDWIRYNKNMVVKLNSLDNLKNITLEFINEIKKDHEFYGITQDPETNNYTIVFNDICKKCNKICNAIHFEQKFIDWSSGNNDIDKLIQDIQLSSHEDVNEVLEWIPYDRLDDIKYIKENKFGKVYRANWNDGYIYRWAEQDWIRYQNMIVQLKSLNNLKNVTFEFINEIKFNNTLYGITQNPKTNNYMIVIDDICEKCNYACNSIYFQRNFKNWTSGNNYIDKLIQDTQLSVHYDANEALEWVPYDNLYNIKYIKENKSGKVYRANWIDGKICSWNDTNEKLKKKNLNMFVILKSLNNPINFTLEFANKIKINHEFYGITQDIETKSYMIVLNDICEKCNYKCNSIYFQQKFIDWTSGNKDIDKFIQDTQLLAHKNDEISHALKWIPYSKFCNIEYIARGGFGKVYKANWIDGNISYWDNKNQFWKRYNENMYVALKSLNNSKKITLEFMNEMMLHHKVDDDFRITKFYGITQDPETENYVMVLKYANDGSLRKYLDIKYYELNWKSIFRHLDDIISGLNFIHKKELIHRDLHIGNILKHENNVSITDMGLCKPANCDLSKNNIYGILPYIAPEILRGQNYTKAADIYSFGINMYELISSLPPYYDLSHDNNLAIKICQGLRPRFNIKVPQLIVQLIKRCLDANQLNRPTAVEVINILRKWQYKESDNETVELQKQIKETEKINNNSRVHIKPSTNLGISYKPHSGAIYTI
ncbi:Ypk2p [Rhizophagus irregularis DAOM 197198w]|uniref:Ypk2p n=1 Tax=Rhizophagus irregularis (strain DAOM 197198w) TaxID=1432141 RepID=A0A015KZ04_RHIIW|nr:Ypk2p [Rhizophagus irregularis DAOM 197198w]